MDTKDPRLMAMILSREGFLKWAEGNPLTKKDFKPQWEYLLRGFASAMLAGSAAKGK